MIEIKQRDKLRRMEKYPELINEMRSFLNAQLQEYEENINYVVVGEFEEGANIDFTICLYLKDGQLCYCKKELEDDLSNWKEVALQLCLGYSKAVPNMREKQLEEGFFEPLNRKIIFDRIYGTYRFNDEECEALLAGKTIFFVTDSLPKDGEDQYKYLAIGKLEQCDYEGEGSNEYVTLVGFRRFGFKRDMRYKQFTPYFGNHRYTTEEIYRLLSGETIYVETTSKTKVDKDGNPKPVKANLKLENFEIKPEWVR